MSFLQISCSTSEYSSGFRPRLNQQTLPEISCYAASAPHLQQFPVMTLSKKSLWQASLCKAQVSFLPCSALSASLPLPALCAADAHWPSYLCLASCCRFSLSDSVCLSVCWLTAPSGVSCRFWFALPDFFFSTFGSSRCIWCHLLSFKWITLLIVFWLYSRMVCTAWLD